MKEMFKTKLIVLLSLLWILNGCSGTTEYELLQTSAPQSTLEKNSLMVSDRSIEYLILPQDRLDVSLYKDPQSNTAGSSGNNAVLGQSMIPKGILVDARGYVPLPLIGKIKLSGLTQTQAADYISKEYKKYLNTPSVYVEVLNKRVLVLGEVRNPGVVNLDREKITLFEALAKSGDFTDAAIRDSVLILSNNPGKGMVMRTVNLTNADTLKFASLMLRPNDIVYVKPTGWKEFSVASAEVLSPLDPLLKIAGTYATFKYLFD